MNKKAVIIADDHKLIREVVKEGLEETGMYEVDTADCLRSVLEMIENHNGYDVVLLDYRMPGMNGLEGLHHVIEVNKKGRVAMLTGVSSQNLASQIVDAGGYGLISKDLSKNDIVNAVQIISLGQIYMSNDAIASLSPTAEKGKRTKLLTPREESVLLEISFAKSNQEIAETLGISESTVKVFVRQITNKLGASNRMDAVLKAQEAGII